MLQLRNSFNNMTVLTTPLKSVVSPHRKFEFRESYEIAQEISITLELEVITNYVLLLFPHALNIFVLTNQSFSRFLLT